jgi:hypothetical protein
LWYTLFHHNVPIASKFLVKDPAARLKNGPLRPVCPRHRQLSCLRLFVPSSESASGLHVHALISAFTSEYAHTRMAATLLECLASEMCVVHGNQCLVLKYSCNDCHAFYEVGLPPLPVGMSSEYLRQVLICHTYSIAHQPLGQPLSVRPTTLCDQNGQRTTYSGGLDS